MICSKIPPAMNIHLSTCTIEECVRKSPKERGEIERERRSGRGVRGEGREREREREKIIQINAMISCWEECKVWVDNLFHKIWINNPWRANILAKITRLNFKLISSLALTLTCFHLGLSKKSLEAI